MDEVPARLKGAHGTVRDKEKTVVQESSAGRQRSIGDRRPRDGKGVVGITNGNGSSSSRNRDSR